MRPQKLRVVLLSPAREHLQYGAIAEVDRLAGLDRADAVELPVRPEDAFGDRPPESQDPELEHVLASRCGSGPRVEEQPPSPPGGQLALGGGLDLGDRVGEGRRGALAGLRALREHPQDDGRRK